MPGKTRTCRLKNFPIPIGDEEDQLVCGVLNEPHKKGGKKPKQIRKIGSAMITRWGPCDVMTGPVSAPLATLMDQPKIHHEEEGAQHHKRGPRLCEVFK